MWAMPKTRELHRRPRHDVRPRTSSTSRSAARRGRRTTPASTRTTTACSWNNFAAGRLLQARRRPRPCRSGCSRAGYQTIHIGKYLNEYGERDPREVPHGLGRVVGRRRPDDLRLLRLHAQPQRQAADVRRASREDYSTDVYAGLAEREIRDAARAGKPFFLNVAPNAPHTVAVEVGATMEGTPAVPAPRDAARLRRRRDAALPELQRGRHLRQAGARWRVLPDADDRRATIASLAATTAAGWARCSPSTTSSRASSGRSSSAGVYRNTDIIFTSDNGWILGEHRLHDPVTEDGNASGVKYFPFEGSSRVPLMAAGPGLPGGREGRGRDGQRRPRADDPRHRRRRSPRCRRTASRCCAAARQPDAPRRARRADRDVRRTRAACRRTSRSAPSATATTYSRTARRRSTTSSATRGSCRASTTTRATTGSRPILADGARTSSRPARVSSCHVDVGKLPKPAP